MRLSAVLAATLVTVAVAAAGTAGAGSRAVRRHAPLAAAPSSAPAVSRQRPLYGVTLDRIRGLPGVLAGLRTLPYRPTVRVYFDVREPASYYERAVTRIAKVGAVMGDLLDSSDERSISVAGMRARARSYVHLLGRHVTIWEVGNEVNGSWTGSHRPVAQKLVAAYAAVKAAGAKTALTLYANDFGPDHCGDGRAELTPLQFSRRWVPASLAHWLDYVLLSYYPTECGGREPSAETVAVHLKRLRGVFPNAALGFGEVGLTHAARRATWARAARIMLWAYSLHPGPRCYVGGYFWWYAAEDALRRGAALARALRSAFGDEARALGG
ncbi:MAG: hypothetical protein JO321_13810 [Solirubrobacterales bacterium]|nr:hypothetical protein [Solirubrobacterales bacterium]MBV9165257.1 hypothetical protein [Solirubrobacterales bacterium]MBV9536477.1 hypothetical protein [Solirubrobacterales bacterium]